jgi:hypothetical protein
MNQALYAHMNNKRKMKKKIIIQTNTKEYEMVNLRKENAEETLTLKAKTTYHFHTELYQN